MAWSETLKIGFLMMRPISLCSWQLSFLIYYSNDTGSPSTERAVIDMNAYIQPRGLGTASQGVVLRYMGGSRGENRGVWTTPPPPPMKAGFLMRRSISLCSWQLSFLIYYGNDTGLPSTERAVIDMNAYIQPRGLGTASQFVLL